MSQFVHVFKVTSYNLGWQPVQETFIGLCMSVIACMLGRRPVQETFTSLCMSSSSDSMGILTGALARMWLGAGVIDRLNNFLRSQEGL